MAKDAKWLQELSRSEKSSRTSKKIIKRRKIIQTNVSGMSNSDDPLERLKSCLKRLSLPISHIFDALCEYGVECKFHAREKRGTRIEEVLCSMLQISVKAITSSDAGDNGPGGCQPFAMTFCNETQLLQCKHFQSQESSCPSKTQRASISDSSSWNMSTAPWLMRSFKSHPSSYCSTEANPTAV